jgi:drug/metabolite transporter (DMT)-like permease
MKEAIAVGIAVITGAVGDIMLSKGMQSQGEVSIKRLGDIPPLVKLVFTNRFILVGILSMTVYFGSYITALAWVDVSIVIPLTALSYVIATTYAVLRMREHVGLQRWAGVILITIGSVFIGLSA